MTKGWRAAAAAVALLIAISGSGTAFAQKRGGIHPANAMTVHEVVGKSALGFLAEPGPRWG